MPEYYDLGIRFWEKDLESFATSLGFKGICSFSPQGKGVEIAGRSVEDLRFKKDGRLVLFSSNNLELLKKACRKDVDVLLFPKFAPDVALVRAAAERKKPFEIPLSLLLNSDGVGRAYLMARIRFFMKVCNKYSADFILTSGAVSKLTMKSPHELIAVGEALGLSHDQAVKSISMVPEHIMEGIE